MIRLALRVRREDAEIVARRAARARAGGRRGGRRRRDVVEYAVYGAPGELPALPDLRAAAGGALVEVRDDRGRRRLGASAGASSTARSTVGGRLHVRAPWHPDVSAEARRSRS